MIYIYINYYYFYYDIYQKRFGKCNEMVIVTICYMCIDGMLSISPIWKNPRDLNDETSATDDLNVFFF